MVYNIFLSKTQNIGKSACQCHRFHCYSWSTHGLTVPSLHTDIMKWDSSRAGPWALSWGETVVFSRLTLSIVLRRDSSVFKVDLEHCLEASTGFCCGALWGGSSGWEVTHPWRGGGSVTTGVARKARSRSAGTDRYIPHEINESMTFRQRTFRQPTLRQRTFRQRTFRQRTFRQNRQGGHFANLIFFSSKLRCCCICSRPILGIRIMGIRCLWLVLQIH